MKCLAKCYTKVTEKLETEKLIAIFQEKELSLTMRNGCDWLKTDSDYQREKNVWRWALILLRGWCYLRKNVVILQAEKCCG